MSSQTRARLADALSADSVSRYALTVGDIAESGDAREAESALVEQLRDLASAEMPHPDLRGVMRRLKVCHGLGILAAAQGSDKQQTALLERTLFALLGRPNRACPGLTANLALCELTYTDQFVGWDTRVAINSAIGRRLCNSRYPAARDYLKGWQIMTKRRRILELTGEPRRLSGPRVFIVGSVKGGVGKSITSVAVLHYLTHLPKPQRTALVDLDPSGPSAQYYLRLGKAADGLRTFPSPQTAGPPLEGQEWCYPTFLDLLLACDAPGRRPRSEALERMAADLILPVDDEHHQGAVVLPDSPTFCSQVAARRDDEVDRSAFLASLDGVMAAAKSEGYRNVILDLGPGTYGINGAVFSWVARRYPATLILMSSPRAFDLASSLYEASWLSAAGECAWQGGVLHLVNMWKGAPRSLLGKLDKWADEYVPAAMEASIALPGPNITPASLIYAWRLWSYLYVRSLARLRERLVRQLPEDPRIRALSLPPEDDRPFSVDAKALQESSWYKHLADILAPISDPNGAST